MLGDDRLLPMALASHCMDGRTGTVASVNVSAGGVPKLPVERAYVSHNGMEGDRQADLRHHGGPLQTLCLFSLEVIEQLRAEGHPIDAGSAGENITLTGIDWNLMAGGVRLEIGDTLVAEVTVQATPCSKNARWFSDRKFGRIDHDEHPGSSRWYARVLEPGPVATGDGVTIEPTQGSRPKMFPTSV